jgi:ZIP family zinc transporter
VVILVALVTVVSTAAGGLFALRHQDRLHLVLGFTAGVLLGLVAFDLLPEVFELGDGLHALGLPAVMLAFVGGFLVLHVVERTMALHDAHEGEYGSHAHQPNLGLVSALALCGHSFLDGVGIGLAFHVSTDVGIGVAVAVVAHDFADGLNTVSLMIAHGNTARRAKLLLAGDALAPIVGAATTLAFTLPPQFEALYLGFFAGFLLYLATGDILPEAHSRHPSRLTLLLTVAGVTFIGAVVALSPI